MEPVWIIVPLVIIAVIGFIALSTYLAAKRRQELREWADRNGWRFNQDYDYGVETRYPHFSCLQEGSQRYGYNFVDGEHGGRAFTTFDYHYETYSTDSKGRRQTHHHYFSAAVVEADVALKPLFIRAEHFFDKVGEFLGFDDIDFESAEFSREFCVKAPDRRWAFDSLPQETMEFLLQSPRFTLDFQGHHVIAYRSSTFSVPDFEAALAVVAGVLDRLPASVVRELKEGR